MGIQVRIAPHPLLDAVAFSIELPRPLEQCPSPPELVAALALEALAPMRSDDLVRKAVRDLLRHGGYKPTGRGKPASEYLLGAATERAMPVINLVVDACNAASLHSGLPISVVDLDRARAPFSVAIQPEGASYVFNASGQTIDLGGLVCLCDAEGPCANGVKDAQRTKTHAGTMRALAIVWGTRALDGRAQATARYFRSLLSSSGAVTHEVELVE